LRLSPALCCGQHLPQVPNDLQQAITPDGRLRTREDRAALPPLVDALRDQFGMFRRHELADAWDVALAAERALALEEERLTALDKVAWIAAVDALVAEWTEDERTAMENRSDQIPATANAEERRRRRRRLAGTAKQADDRATAFGAQSSD
jgi:hypothetical protein